VSASDAPLHSAHPLDELLGWASQHDTIPSSPSNPPDALQVQAAQTWKIACIIGTRPEAVKMIPVIRELRRRPAQYNVTVCVTWQHEEILHDVLQVFGVVPDVNLRLMSHDQSLASLTSRALTAVDAFLSDVSPDLVLVQGDTTTVLAATLAAFYRRIPVGHVEAGLRTWNLNAPWPEEANRVLVSRIARLHFAPTSGAKENLVREGVAADDIAVTGNTVVDALLDAIKIVECNEPEIPGVPKEQIADCPLDRSLVLVTGHRRENFGTGIANICGALRTLATSFPEAQIIYPVHPNPNVRGPVLRSLGGVDKPSNLHIISPLSYLQFVALMNRASLILTDSGGVQEEAPSLGVPVLVMRETTERPEAVAAGCSKVIGTNSDRIIAEVSESLMNRRQRTGARPFPNPYGDGNAARRVVEACTQYLALSRTSTPGGLAV
jgi:UDP-N-acetylglucosamine 2-epimerase (non-hydrolysing)